MMWSAVCSEAPHSQFGEGAAPHLYMDEWNPYTLDEWVLYPIVISC